MPTFSLVIMISGQLFLGWVDHPTAEECEQAGAVIEALVPAEDITTACVDTDQLYGALTGQETEKEEEDTL